MYILLLTLSFLLGITPLALLLVYQCNLSQVKPYFPLVVLSAVTAFVSYFLDFIWPINLTFFGYLAPLLSFICLFCFYRFLDFKTPKYFFSTVSVLFLLGYVLNLRFRSTVGLEFSKALENLLLGVFVLLATCYWLKDVKSKKQPIPLMQNTGAYFILACLLYACLSFIIFYFFSFETNCFSDFSIYCYLTVALNILCATLFSIGLWRLKY